MPKQHVLFGRPVPRIAPRRFFLLLILLSAFAVFTLIFTLPSAIPSGPSLSKFADHKFHIPTLKGTSSSVGALNPFRNPSHPPPRQANDTHGGSHWYSDWKWLSMPFSSTVTLDENRSLLPPLRDRPSIYCYYDTTATEKEKEGGEARSELLLAWRRAWWAQGFRPIILSTAEAMNNPMYDEIQKRDDLDKDVRVDIMRWLAWENMGGGLLADYLLFPMGAYDDPLLSFLRRGKYPQLTMWKKLGNGLFGGDKASISAALKEALHNPLLKTTTTLGSAVANDMMTVDATAESLAFYSDEIVEEKYGVVNDALRENHAQGLRDLKQLINAHLHATWMGVFSSGIAVLKPLSLNATHMVSDSLHLAQRLAHCSTSPMPSSCPPNRPQCTPCSETSKYIITTPARYSNKTTLYTIGAVPHPYTQAILHQRAEAVDVAWVRQSMARDAWLGAAMRDLVDERVSIGPRVLRFKEAVAAGTGPARSLWVSAEKDLPEDVDWHFGFAIPTEAVEIMGGIKTSDAEEDGGVPEQELLEQAKKVGHSKAAADVQIRNAVEAWNLADTEAWKFARAFFERSRMERLKWEEEEAKYVGGAGIEKGRRKGWGRWLKDD